MLLMGRSTIAYTWLEQYLGYECTWVDQRWSIGFVLSSLRICKGKMLIFIKENSEYREIFFPWLNFFWKNIMSKVLFSQLIERTSKKLMYVKYASWIVFGVVRKSSEPIIFLYHTVPNHSSANSKFFLFYFPFFFFYFVPIWSHILISQIWGFWQDNE